jgi:hypothetical protein
MCPAPFGKPVPPGSRCLASGCPATHAAPAVRAAHAVLCCAQGPLILAERWVLLRMARAKLRLPRLLRVLATLGTLLCIAHYLFFLPAERIKMTTNFAAAMRHFFASLAGLESQPLPPVHWQR